IEAVYSYTLQKPRIRFLIADDPGAGKTIMAGLIIKELKIRKIIKNILIVAPGHLKDQWRREMSDRFEETFIPVGRTYLDSLFGQNVWLRENQIVTSIDFAKREDVLPSLAAAFFDLIIVDEAHKMSAYRYGDKIDKTSRYKLGETLSKITNHLLFLTATPHKGDPENFRLFLDLLEPGFFATNEMLEESIKNKDNELFIRRIKEDLKNFEGEPLFLPRYVNTIAFQWGSKSPHEKTLYNDLSKYVNTQYNRALSKDKRRNIAFALVILQRRLASSTYALLKSLERRKNRLEEYLKGAEQKVKMPEKDYDFDIVDDMSEDERWKEEEIWETLSVAENKEELKREIETIQKLIEQAKKIINNEEEIKLKQFKSALIELAKKYDDPKDKKILVFTESKDTLEYLERKIKAWRYSTNTIHGGMKLEERVKAESIFKNETDVMVATEAAGEGINLQFCHLMINYDIPWNPNRLEQRMGRIHRYGQDKEVHIFNLVAIDSREGRVLNKLFEKLEEIRDAMGSDKVFDVLNEVLYNQNLSQLMMEAAANARNLDEILKNLDIKVDKEYISKIKDNLGESLATRYIDYTRIKEMAQKAREQRLIPEYTENYFKKAFAKLKGKLRKRNDGFLAIDSIPYDIRKIADQDLFKKSYGEMLKKYPKVTFDKEIAFKNQDAEFISFGHPLFESVLNFVEEQYSDAMMRGAVFLDQDGKYDGHILFYEGEIKDGTGAIAGKRLFCFYLFDNGLKAISPAVIWDLAETKIKEKESIDVENLKNSAHSRAIEELEKYKAELLKERERQANIKKKYGYKSLEHLICELDGDLINLNIRKEQGDNVDLVIFNKKERKENYEKALEELKDQIEKEQSLTMSMPRFRGMIKVVPQKEQKIEMHSDPEIEQIGMETAMDYEKEEGRLPEDVSEQELGFDIRSFDPEKEQMRYIEVKARSKTAFVELTRNEWFKAHRFKSDYYLYAVMEASTKPQLYIIQNPAENVKAEEKIKVVRYQVPFSEIRTKGETIN
ncbi:MAG: DUF3883 domain-containing protein, partial [Candidatus Lokiarchaeota archaeon]|nr:DUF3883 domain-containing protein [Candidatus Lokiarchaeota archaeon]